MNSIKKILVTLILSTSLISVSNNVIAGSCSPKPYPISNVVSRTVQKATGLNFLVKHGVQSQIKKEILKTAKGDIKVNLDLYSVGDLIAGKFKGINLSGKNLKVENINISSVEANTLCDFVHLNLKKNPVEPLSNIFIGFKSVITEKDLNDTLNSSAYKSLLSELKINNLVSLAISNPKINVEDNKIKLSGKISFSGMPSMFSLPVNLGLKVVPDKSKIRLVALEILSEQFIDINFLNLYVKTMKPVVFDLNSLSDKGEEYNINHIDFKNDAINIDGTFFLPAKKQNKSKI
jgi:hypothetical protein